MTRAGKKRRDAEYGSYLVTKLSVSSCANSALLVFPANGLSHQFLSPARDDQLMCVFAFFEARDLHNFLCCNKHFHRIASDDFLWR